MIEYEYWIGDLKISISKSIEIEAPEILAKYVHHKLEINQ